MPRILKVYTGNSDNYHNIGSIMTVKRVGTEFSVYLGTDFSRTGYFNAVEGGSSLRPDNDTWGRLRDFQAGQRWKIVNRQGAYSWLENVSWPQRVLLPEGV